MTATIDLDPSQPPVPSLADVAEAELIALLEQKRIESGWTVAELCSQMEIGVATWSLIRNGWRRISDQTLTAIWGAFPEYGDAVQKIAVARVAPAAGTGRG